MAPDAGFTSWSSALIVPDSTLNSDSWPTYGSAMVLNTKASGWPDGVGLHLGLGVAGAHGDRRAVGGGGPDLADEVGQAVDADAGDGRAAHDREHGGVGHAVGQGVLQLGDARHLALEVALHQLVVGHHDALDQVVVHLVLELGQVLGDLLGRCGCRRRRR